MSKLTAEDKRVKDAWSGGEPWLRWGPYLSERQWGTVREDYSPHGNAWDYFPHDQARSRAYRWGEDGIGGISDDLQRLCFAVALWNGRDGIVKERLFGLTNNEGNHGEDVKEYYFYLDSTPSHSYMRMAYKYPHAAFPYEALVAENGRRKGHEGGALEFELLDTGVFDGDRYFDVEVEYAKRGPDDILVRINVTNRGPEAHDLVLLPTLWYRNTWSWGSGQPKPVLAVDDSAALPAMIARHETMGTFRLLCPDADELLFVDNETNNARLYGTSDSPAYPKDGINDHIVAGAPTVRPEQTGTKAAALYRRSIAPGETMTVKLRLADDAGGADLPVDFDATFTSRIAEADAFYDSRIPAAIDADQRAVMRQAYAGMLWTKQFFHFVVEDWLNGDELPAPRERLYGRNTGWRHFYAEDIFSMPDKWEYPWFASWDLCFHAVVLCRLDLDFAKEQILLLSREWYMSPDGQVPAYEWAFDDLNPPLQAWAALEIYKYEKQADGRSDFEFLRRVFNHGLLYFTWWVNRKDRDDNNLFQGGFLGLDNIAVFDRSSRILPGNGNLYQSDGTSWVAFFALKLMEIATELSHDRPSYLDFAAKFFQHFLYIADAMNHVARVSDGGADLWDDEEGFYFDVLRLGDSFQPLRVRSLVGLIPLLPVSELDLQALEAADNAVFKERLEWFERQQAALLGNAAERHDEERHRLLLSIVDKDRLRRVLQPMLDETEFLSDHGIRSMSQRHRDAPYVVHVEGQPYTAAYEPAESAAGLFGGNSNWRGPIWFPVNYLLVGALRAFHRHLGDDFKVECPTGSGVWMTLDEAADEVSRRLISVFTRNAAGRRPVFGGNERFQNDPHWRDRILFYEYFHGDNGAGLGASHQTGWTGLVAVLMEELAGR